MPQQYLMPMARNGVTGVTVKSQDLGGAQYGLHQRVVAQTLADQLAEKMTYRTRDPWVGFVKVYTPAARP